MFVTELVSTICHTLMVAYLDQQLPQLQLQPLLDEDKNEDKNEDKCDNGNNNGNKGWGRWTRAGARDADMSWAPGMFFLFLFYIILMFTLQIYTDTLPLLWRKGEWAWAQNGHKKKKQRWQQRRRRGWEMRAEGWVVWTGAGAGAWDADASQAPGMFFLFVIYIILMITLQIYTATLPLR